MMNILEWLIKAVNDDNEHCACCGNTFTWWLKQPRTSVFVSASETLYCSYKCLKENNEHKGMYVRYWGKGLSN